MNVFLLMKLKKLWSKVQSPKTKKTANENGKHPKRQAERNHLASLCVLRLA